MSDLSTIPQLSAKIVLSNGSEITFNQTEAVDMGDFVSEHVHQKCYMQQKGEWRVFFRPDADGSRKEVVVEYGAITQGPAAHHMEPYTLHVDGEKIEVPYHFYGARWRWFDKPRPAVRTLDEIKAHPLVPRLSLKSRHFPNLWAPKYERPMDRAGIAQHMQGTGQTQGNNVGYITGIAALALLSGKDSHMQGVLDQAEGYGTVPVHNRTNDGQILNILRADRIFPDIDNFELERRQDSSKPWVVSTAPHLIDHQNDYLPDYVKVDTAHHPNFHLIPFLLTGDPYYLEELHFKCMFSMTWSRWYRTHNKAKQTLMVETGQVRSIAWNLRDLVHAHYLTPDDTPAWILPRSYFDKAVTDHTTELNAWAQDPIKMKFGFFDLHAGKGRPVDPSPWMDGFLKTILGMAIRAGYDQFRPIFETMYESTVNRFNGTSGFDRRFTSMYRAHRSDVQVSNSWKQLSDKHIARHGFPSNADKNNVYGTKAKWGQYAGMGYAEMEYGVLCVAKWIGYDTEGCLEWLHKVREGKKSERGKKKFQVQWSFDPGF